jgi:anti-sigma regulatory factor (Ser/Thr protein kinase)
VTDDQIIVSIPRDEGFVQVAALVLGGFASRLNITYESLDDLNTALETLVERAQANGHVTVKIRYDGRSVHADIGPFRGEALKRELERGAERELGLRRILGTIVDRFELGERGDGQWVTLEKTVEQEQSSS